MTEQNLNPNPDPNPDPANDNGGASRSRFESRRARFHCAGGAGGDLQNGRHHVHRRPFRTAAHAVQEPGGRHLDVRPEAHHP